MQNDAFNDLKILIDIAKSRLHEKRLRLIKQGGKKREKEGDGRREIWVTYLKAGLEVVSPLSLEDVVTGSSGFVFALHTFSHR